MNIQITVEVINIKGPPSRVSWKGRSPMPRQIRKINWGRRHRRQNFQLEIWSYKGIKHLIGESLVSGSRYSNIAILTHIWRVGLTLLSKWLLIHPRIRKQWSELLHPRTSKPWLELHRQRNRMLWSKFPLPRIRKLSWLFPGMKCIARFRTRSTFSTLRVRKR